MVYLLNSPVLTRYGQWSFTGPLSVDRVRQLLADDYISALGHEATAKFVSEVLGIPCKFNRISVRLDVGDCAIVFRLLGRMEEGEILDLDRLQQLPYEFALLRCLGV